MGKKIVVPCLDVMMIAFYPRNIQLSISLKDHISNTKRVQRIVLMPSGHPIILLKSNSFNIRFQVHSLMARFAM